MKKLELDKYKTHEAIFMYDEGDDEPVFVSIHKNFLKQMFFILNKREMTDEDFTRINEDKNIEEGPNQMYLIQFDREESQDTAG